MALETKRIYRIQDSLSALNPAQIGVETVADTDLGYKMYGGKDDAGDITKWLAKDKPGQLTTLKLTGASTTTTAGLLKHDSAGAITGGLITVADFNTFISDGGIQWTRDASGFLEPLTDTDRIIVGDGLEAAPGVALKSNPTSGMYHGTIKTGVTGVGISHGGVEMMGVGVETGVPTLVLAPSFGTCKIEHAVSSNAIMSIENLGTTSGDEAHLTIKSEGITAASSITLDTYILNADCYQQINLTTTLQEITLQAQGGTLGGIIAEASYFEFQNYTAYSPIPVWNSGTQWAAYESQFGTEYPILQAIVDNATGGGSVVEPAGQIVYGTGTGVDSDANMHWDATNQELIYTKNNSETNWYDGDAAVIKMTGTATQGMVISSDKNITVGVDNAVTDYDPVLSIINRNTNGGDCTINIDANGAVGDTHISAINLTSTSIDSADAQINLTATTDGATAGDDAFVNIKSITNTGSSTTNISAQTAAGVNHTDIEVTLAGIEFTSTAVTGRMNWNAAAEILQLEKYENATNWYDSTAPAINLTGTATQGQVIKSDKKLILGTRNTTASTDAELYIYSENTITDQDAYIDIRSTAVGNGYTANAQLTAEGKNNADAYTFIEARTNDGTSPGDDCYITIKTYPQTGQTGYIDIVADDVDIAAVRHVGYKAKYTITVTANAFEISQNNGDWQEVTITANSTFGIRAPTNDLNKTFLEIYNSGGSDYTLTVTDSAMKDSTGSVSACKIRWVDPLTDGFTIPAGEMVACTIFYKGETGGDPEWIVSANTTTSESFGE